jgi:murein L,D-transpeptidase YcbB/YkuD
MTFISLSTVSAALMCAGIVSAQAAGTYYDPTNQASSAGKTTGYELYQTIGCPGRQLLDPACKAEVKPAPAPKPAPVAKKPEPVAPKGKTFPNAKPGECYANVISEPVYTTKQVKKLVKEAGERIEIVPPVYKAVKVHVTSEETQEVVPAQFETVKERVMVKPATTRLEPVPAVYETVEERVMVKASSKKAIDVPAVYEDVTERKLVRAAYTTWKPGTQTNIQKIDDKTGDIFCLVEVPAEYQTVTNRVLKTPATVRYEETPAVYDTIKKTVLKTPETTRAIEVPAEYAEREVTKLVKPATTTTKVVPVDYMRETLTQVSPQTEKRVPVPAEYAMVDEKVLVSAGQERWTQILCDVNATPAKVAEVQKALGAAGFDTGSSGVLDAATLKAIAAYQKAKGLSQDGYLTVETVKALGLSEK